MLQDYHLYLCPSLIRKQLDDIFLSQFIHIPWPQSEYFKIIPEYMRKEIIDGLLSNNILGFHIPRYVTNFIQSCEEFAEKVDYEQGIIYHNGIKTHVKSYPISIDYNNIKQMAHSKGVIDKEEIIRKIKGNNFLIYRTDRLDLSKNIIRGFEAYDLFLKNHPECHGRVKFLSTGKPTRQQIKEYKEYNDQIQSLIHEINDKYGRDGWKPIECIFRADYELVVAAFKNYDCLLVNPIADGMNIVPKEASAVNENKGILILSENAGCYDELKEHVISVSPFDIKQTAESFYKALEMSDGARKEKLQSLQEIISKRTIYDWISEQFVDFERLMDNDSNSI